MTDAAPPAGAVLSIDLAAIGRNWQRLQRQVAPAVCAGVAKANGYGLGLEAVGDALWRAGCRVFFVAQSSEGVRLRAALPDATIAVLNGLMAGEESMMLEHRLMPVLNDAGQVDRWSRTARAQEALLPAILHVDTGMARLGLAAADMAQLADSPDRFAGIRLAWVMSHLVIAEEPDHPLNRQQRDAFVRARQHLPAAAASLANSSGIFLGRPYHFDMARPGVALYGVNPQPGRPNPMEQVVGIKARILQLREIDRGQTVGYGATFSAARPSRIATLAAGYADGFPRSLSGHSVVHIAGRVAPVAGRVSMDLITVDVSGLPADSVVPGGWANLTGPEHDLDALAADAGTIAYELLVGLGQRFERRYTAALPHTAPPHPVPADCAFADGTSADGAGPADDAGQSG
ncbi:MAG: alanine racemase [Alphaproteobacteria bacterium]